MLLKGRGFRPIGNMIVGAIGAIAGGALISFTGLSAPGAMGSLFAAAISAAILLALLGLTRRP